MFGICDEGREVDLDMRGHGWGAVGIEKEMHHRKVAKLCKGDDVKGEVFFRKAKSGGGNELHLKSANDKSWDLE